MRYFLHRFVDWFRGFFYYTQTERKGIVALSILLIVLLVIPPIMYWLYKPVPTDFTEYANEIAAFKANLPLNADEKGYENTSKTPSESFPFDPNTASEADFIRLGLSEKTAGTIVKYRSKGGKFRSPDDFGKIYSIKPSDLERLKPLIHIEDASSPYKKTYSDSKFPSNPPKVKAENFAFDPNTAAETDFVRLGLSPKTAASILNYRNKGGKFKTKEDFKKIYTLSPEDFSRLEPFITIAAPLAGILPKPSAPAANTNPPPSLAPNTNAAFTPQRKNTTVKIDVNTADVDDWQQLRGIGIGYANKINSYREKLGGFVKLEQIKEIYNFPDSVYQRILPQLTLSPGIRKMKINSMTAEQLKNHPYLGWKYANIIVSYRDQHGKYKQVADLKQTIAIDENLFARIAPYVSVE